MNKNEKHAYLIMSHGNFEILKVLLSLLDDDRNDIFLHVDRKAKKFDEKDFRPLIRKSSFFLVERLDVRWGTRKQIELEIIMFETAYKKGNYCYYHLLSGVDLPLKNNDYIHHFFEKYAGAEFVGFVDNEEVQKHLFKVQLFHLFSWNLKDKRSISSKLHRRFMLWQFNHHLFLRNKNIDFRKGANWVSVTQNFVIYLLSKKKEIYRRYRFTYGADEIFLQTILWNSPFRLHIYNIEDEYGSCMRKICWDRGTPYVWTEADLDELASSDKLFARKFDESHMEIVYEIMKKIQMERK